VAAKDPDVAVSRANLPSEIGPSDVAFALENISQSSQLGAAIPTSPRLWQLPWRRTAARQLAAARSSDGSTSSIRTTKGLIL